MCHGVKGRKGARKEERPGARCAGKMQIKVLKRALYWWVKGGGAERERVSERERVQD